MTAQVVALPRSRVLTPVLESKLVGALLDLGLTRVTLIASGINDGDWLDDRCRAAWAILKRLAEKERPISAAVVFSAGKAVRAFAETDLEWLEGLQLANIITLEALPGLLEDLRLGVRARNMAARLETMASALRAGTYDESKLFAGLAEAQGLLLEPTGGETATSDLFDLIESWDRNETEKRAVYVPTGIKLLDEMITGFPPSLTLIIGRPGGGKTGTLASMIRAQLYRDSTANIGLFGLEDGSAWLAKRWLALESDMVLREVGWKRRTEEQTARLTEVAANMRVMLDRVHVYRRDRLGARDLVRRAASMIRNQKVSAIYIDNLSEVELGGTFWEAGGELNYGLRKLANDTGVPVVALAHINEAQQPGASNGPPRASDVRGGRSFDQRARLMLGLWPKGDAWRCTVLKANEAESGKTIEFDRHKESAMINVDGGRVVNLAQERREASEQATQQKHAAQDRRVAERAAKRAAEKAATAAAKAAQAQATLGLVVPRG